MKQVNVKKLILPNIPYVFIALLATKVSEAVRLAPGSDASTKLLNIMTGLNTDVYKRQAHPPWWWKAQSSPSTAAGTGF